MGALWRQTKETAEWLDKSSPRAHPGGAADRRCRSEDRHGECRQVSITLSEDCLCRLLDRHQLVVEEFTCADGASKDCVHRLLLTLISR